MLKKIIIPTIATIALVASGISAFTFTGTPEELKGLQEQDVLGSRTSLIVPYQRVVVSSTPTVASGADLGSYILPWNNVFASGTFYGDGSGLTGLSGASNALDNLASVAINTSLLPDANNVDDLGAFGTAWADIYASGTVYTSSTETQVLQFAPGGVQTITADTDTINAENFSHYHLSSDADYVVTSTPSIPDGNSGQVLFIHNDGSFTIDLQDEGDLTGSNIILNGADSTIKVNSVMSLLFDSTADGWIVISNPNSSAAGANADTIGVRNTSGGAIPSGSVVYVTGFNVGQNRITIDLADADLAAKMPAIGITAATINNNANGEVITSGSAIALIDTSGETVNGGVWVSGTAGGVVFSKPATDFVQKIGTISRVNSSGNVLVSGAGRTNDVPWNSTMANLGLLNGTLAVGNGTASTTIAYNTTSTFVGDIDFSGNLARNGVNLTSTSTIPFLIPNTAGTSTASGVIDVRLPYECNPMEAVIFATSTPSTGQPTVVDINSVTAGRTATTSLFSAGFVPQLDAAGLASTTPSGGFATSSLPKGSYLSVDTDQFGDHEGLQLQVLCAKKL